MTDTKHVDPKELFEQVEEGDKIMIPDREEPLTVYRHVTEDDRDGQIITMSEIDEHWEEQLRWERESGTNEDAAPVQAGDLYTGELTGEEFLVARGPRGGAYVLNQHWKKHGGRWAAKISLFRRTRKERQVWGWERYVDVEIIGHEEVDRDVFDVGDGPWVRHTDTDERTIWSNTLDAEVSEYDRTGTVVEEREKPVDILEGVDVGDVVQVNDFPAGTVTEVRDKDDSVLADGSLIYLDLDGEEIRIRTFTEEGFAGVITPDHEGDGDVESVTVDEEPVTDEEGRKAVARELYENTDVGYSVTDGLLIVTTEGETKLPGDVEDIATRHGWERDTEHLTDGEFDPWENSTAFVYKPING